MDPFEVRMQFLGLLRKLDAKQETIQKVVSFALKHLARCGDDLWDCVIEECTRGNVNMRINILYMLDALCETSLLTAQHHVQTHAGSSSATTGTPTTSSPSGAVGLPSTSTGTPGYVKYVARDVDMIVDLVVPEEGNGVLNLMSTRQVLENWRTKRIIDPAIIDNVLQSLDQRKEALHNVAGSSGKTFVHNNILARFQEDRERHKRLRERRWAQPVSQLTAPSLAAFSSSSADGTDPLDVEFSNAWETTSDWNEDDDDAAKEENVICFGNENGELPPDPPAPQPAAPPPAPSSDTPMDLDPQPRAAPQPRLQQLAPQQRQTPPASMAPPRQPPPSTRPHAPAAQTHAHAPAAPHYSPQQQQQHYSGYHPAQASHPHGQQQHPPASSGAWHGQMQGSGWVQPAPTSQQHEQHNASQQGRRTGGGWAPVSGRGG